MFFWLWCLVFGVVRSRLLVVVGVCCLLCVCLFGVIGVRWLSLVVVCVSSCCLWRCAVASFVVCCCHSLLVGRCSLCVVS